MKLRRLTMRNYRRYIDQTVELPDGVIAVIGPNGSGKSTLLEAIGFALYGAPATRTPKALLRHSDAPPGDAVEVELELELGGQAILIERHLRGEALTPKAALFVDGKAIVQSGANSNQAVTEEVERLLGMDRHAFFTTIVARQKDLHRLAELTPLDRKQLILRMLGVDQIDRAIQQAREQARRAADVLEGMRSQLDDPVALRDAAKARSKELEDAQAGFGAATAEHEKRFKALEQATAALERERNKASARQDAEQALKQAQAALEHANEASRQAAVEWQQVQTATAKLAELPEADPEPLQAALDAARSWHNAKRDLDKLTEPAVPPKPDVAAAEAQLEQAQAAYDAASNAYAASKAERDQIAAQVARMAEADEDAPCPVCQRPMDDHLPLVQKEWEAKQAELEAALATHEAGLSAAKQTLANAKGASRAASESQRRYEVAKAAHEAWAKQATELQSRCTGEAPDEAAAAKALAEARKTADERLRWSAIAEQSDARARTLDAAKQADGDASKRVVEAEASLRALPVADVAKANQAHEAANGAERSALQARHNAEAAVQVATRALEAADAAVARRTEQGNAIKAQEETARYWTALAGGRGRGLLEQFRSHLVSRIRPSINAEASRLLAAFTNGRYADMLLDDDYNLFVRDDGVAYTADRFSGGETDVVHLALRLAVSRLLAERHGAPEMRFLALDEVFGSLDASRRHSVLAALHGLGGLYSQVLLVTHHEGLRDALDGVLDVRLQDGVASVHQG